MAFNYKSIISSINNFAAQHGLTMYAYTNNFKGVIEALDNLQNIQFSISDGTIVNADVNASAAIAGTKIDPDFGSQTIETTGVFSAASGAAATPSITFTGDLNTGIYLPGSDKFGIATGGLSRIVIDSSGNVGIGTTTVSAGLHVVKDVNPVLKLDRGTANNANANLYYNGTLTGQLSAANGDFQISAAGALTPISFYANGSERMRIDNLGNVGIGLTNISGSGSLTLVAGQSYKFAGSGGSTIYGDISADTSHNITFKNNNGTERMRIDSSGRLLLGTITEGYASADNFTVADSGNCGVTIRSGAANLGTIAFSDATSGAGEYNGYIQYSQASTYMAFATNENERMRIDGSGRLLVRTSSARTNYFGVASTYGPSLNIESTTNSNRVISFIHNDGASGAPLFILGNSGNNSTPGGTGTVAANASLGFISFQGGDGTELVEAARVMGAVDGTPGANDMPGKLTFHTTVDGGTAPTERMRINSSGKVYIGTTNDPVGPSAVRLHTRGTSGNAFGATIDTAGYTAYTVSTISGGYAMWMWNTSTSANVGSIYVGHGGVTYNTTSDYRAKENVVDLTAAIPRLKALQVHRFNFKADPETTVDGFLAHEVQTVVPESVTGTHNQVDGDGNPVMQGIDQSKLVPLLTAALQEAITKIETLEQRLSDAGIA